MKLTDDEKRSMETISRRFWKVTAWLVGAWSVFCVGGWILLMVAGPQALVSLPIFIIAVMLFLWGGNNKSGGHLGGFHD
jgi:hypothetical protein